MNTPNSILKKFWGYPDFRGSQHQIIQTVLDGSDTLALMPTGGGKSICYQVPALVNDGICIVVSPLVALIHDQVRQLKSKGIKAIALTGGISPDDLIDLLDNCVYGGYKFLYISPERLQQTMVQERIREMNVNLLAIDEAHCISQWGNDFRPAYLHCSILKELAPNVPMIALTATATPKVTADIVENLKLNQAKIFKDSFSRSNIIFKVKPTEDKLYQLERFVSQTEGSVIVYVRSRRMTLNLTEFLKKKGFKATYFHGGISKADKEERLNSWLKGNPQVMVATNAFGMGVDKPDVRLVVHFQIPDSLESYFQEAGRAGRDGKTSTAVLINSKEDEERAKQQFLSNLPDVSFVKNLYRQLNNYFQIPYGEWVSETLDFEFNTFCRRYELNPNMTYHGLRILDQNSVIALSENYSEKTMLKFVASKAEIFAYLNRHKSSAPVIQSILRTYGGITEFETKINLLLISQRVNISEKNIKRLLQQLNDDGIVEYQSASSDIEITFLVPREDDLTINPFAKNIKELNKVKSDNMDAMLGYVNNTSVCRSIFLLNYFGENIKKACGTCDICTQSSLNVEEDLKDVIKKLLKDGPHTSRKLLQKLKIDEAILLETLQEMLEDETIQLNYRNEYAIR